MYALDAKPDNAFLKKCRTTLLVDLIKQIFTTIDLKYPMKFDDKNSIYTAERAKNLATVAAQSLEQEQLEKFFQIRKPAQQYYKVLQNTPHVRLFTNSPSSRNSL